MKLNQFLKKIILSLKNHDFILMQIFGPNFTVNHKYNLISYTQNLKS